MLRWRQSRAESGQLPRRSNSVRGLPTRADVGKALTAEYLPTDDEHWRQALEVQRKANKIVAILGSKTPHIQNVAVGGVSNPISLNSQSVLSIERLLAIKEYIDELKQFITQVYVVDVAGSAEEVRKIQFAGKHLLGLISDILDLSKIEAGRMDIHLETFDVADMVETVLGTVRPMIDRNANQLVVHCSPSTGFIHADLTKIRQILLNLLSNAAKFTDKGSIRLSVSKLLQGGTQTVQFLIADTGIGMTQAQVTQLFQAFSQGDSSTSRRYGGTGLGLAITKAFTDMLGGNIEVQSKLGSGTVFVVRLPFVNPRDLSGSKRSSALPPEIADVARAAAARAGLIARPGHETPPRGHG